jgi:DNA-binding GntR family transcriptional regulator
MAGTTPGRGGSGTRNGASASETAAPRDAAQAPLYVQVARKLKNEIFRGSYPVGSLVPTEDQLAQLYTDSRHTNRQALREQLDDKLISSRRGVGTVVLPPRVSESNFLHAISINEVLSFASRWDYDIQTIAMDRLDERLASWLDLGRGEQWLAVRGVSRTWGAPFPEAWVEFYIHRDYSGVARLLPRHTGPLFTLIENMFGESIEELHQEITATLIPEELAGPLEVEAGSPAILVRRSCKTADGRIVEANFEIYPASRFRYPVTLRRGKATS